MRWMILPAVLAAFVLALAGCGGSDSSDASSSDDAVTTETIADDETVTDVMTEEETDGSSTDTSGLDLSGSGLSEDCQNFIGAASKYAEAFGSIGSGGTFDLQDSADALEAVANEAPEEIRDAYKTLAAAIGAYAEALDGVDLTSGATPDPATIQKITEATSAFDNQEVAAASEEISAWTTENCGATP